MMAVLRRIIYLCFIVMLMCGCARNTGVVSIGQDTYMISRQAATGFEGSGGIRDAALQEASKFCVSQGKSLHVILIGGHHPPYILGNFPKVDIQFMCLDQNDPRLKSSDLPSSSQLTENKDFTRDNNYELEAKIKTLNKLLEDGMITKDEFDEQKQKLLDNYTSN